MPETVYVSTSFKIGLVKSIKEEQGHGFIAGTRREPMADLFFHYKNLRSPKVKEKDIVLFQTIDSVKHAGKLEAVNVVLLDDVVDFGKLMQLYLRYGYADILRQIEKLTVDELNHRDTEDFLNAVIINELAPTPEKRELLKVRRFITVLKNQANLPPELVKSIFREILERNPLIRDDIFFDVYKTLRDDPVIASAGTDAVALYLSLPEEEKKLHFENLTLTQRLSVRKLGVIDNDDEFEGLLSVLVVRGEDAAANWQLVRKEVILAARFEPLLWLRGILESFPQEALKHHIRDYNESTKMSLLGKMNVDQQISIFPYSRVTDEAGYQLLSLCLLYTEDPVMALEAFRISGLELDPVFYLKCISAGFILFADADLELIRGTVDQLGHEPKKQFIRVIGWRESLFLFDGHLKRDQYGTLKLILGSGEFKPELSEPLNKYIDISPSVAYRLWEEGLIDMPPADKIALHFLQAEDQVTVFRLLKKTAGFHEAIFRAALQKHVNDESRQTEQVPLRLLEAIKQYCPALYYNAKVIVWDKAGEWVRVYLWLYDHAGQFDFLKFAPYFIILSADDQKRFLKKTFHEMHSNPLAVSIWEIIGLKNSAVSPEIARMAGNDRQLIDFSVYVVLQAIEDLCANKVTKPEAMYRIIGDQVRSPKELLVLSGFFDKCKGRLSFTRKEQDEGEPVFIVDSERGEVPGDVLYCEGRKAMVKGTNAPASCERTGTEFWWCRNAKCYGSCVKANDDWNTYTLLDFLEIAGITYNREDYEVFLGYVNKVNKFLSHMTCRSCDHILKPLTPDKSGNYGFYRIGSFSCQNEGCGKLNEQVYLTHCINGFCSGVIDSRDAVKCRRSTDPDGRAGWYICKECLACCTSEGIQRRGYIMEKTGQPYNAAREGHRDLGLVCCPKCGKEMNEEHTSPEDYKRVLDWFVNNRLSSNFIQNSGRRKDGKYWFVVRAPFGDADKMKEFKKKLYRYIAIGLKVPDIAQDKDAYMVAEPFNAPATGSVSVLSCPNGDYQLEVLSDYERYFVMSKYHTQVRFSFKKTS